MRQTLFISDLHLSEQRPHLNHLFDLFIASTLSKKSTQVDAVYILGDFFDVWLGDDLAGLWEQGIAQKLAALVEQGIPVYIMHGNRDFLLGQDFAQSARVTLLADPTVIDLYGNPVILKHGDDLCLDDEHYQRFRSWVRKPWVKRLYLTLPIFVRQRIAGKIRAKSRARGMREIYSKVSDELIQQLLHQYQAKLLIHGHTHCPQIKPQHIILSDWDKQGSQLIVYSDGRLCLDYFGLM